MLIVAPHPKIAQKARGARPAQGATMARKSTTDVTVADLAARIAKAKGIPANQAGKALRGRIRGNFELLARPTVWPSLVKAGKVNKDGNRYTAMPAATADALFTSMTKGTALKDALAKPKKSRKAPEADAPPAEATA
jgi:hypothetical protein